MAQKSAITLSKPSVICRICLANSDLGRLLTPCECKGTQGFVHQECLECWLTTSGLNHCELCLFKFATLDTLRYGMWESMRIWFSHPSNRAMLQADVLVCTLLSMITFGLMVVSVFAMQFLAGGTYHEDEDSDEIERYWMRTSIAVFSGIVIVSFVCNTIAVARANIVPWFRWWRRCKEIQLIIENQGKSDGSKHIQCV